MTDTLRPPEGGPLPNYQTNEDLNDLARTCSHRQLRRVGVSWAGHILMSAGPEPVEAPQLGGWYNVRILNILHQVEPRVLPDVVTSLIDQITAKSKESTTHRRLLDFLFESLHLAVDEEAQPTVWQPKREEQAGQKLIERLREAQKVRSTKPKKKAALSTEPYEQVKTTVHQDQTDQPTVAQEARRHKQERLRLDLQTYRQVSSLEQGIVAHRISQSDPILLTRLIMASPALQEDTRLYGQVMGRREALRTMAGTLDMRENNYLQALYMDVVSIFQTVALGDNPFEWRGEEGGESHRQTLREMQRRALRQVESAADHFIFEQPINEA